VSLADITVNAANKLLDKAGNTHWVDCSVRTCRSSLNILPLELRGKCVRFIDEMEKERASLAHAGRYTFGLIVAMLKDGKGDEAKRFYMRDRGDGPSADRTAGWDTVKRIAELVLELGQYAVPFIVAVMQPCC